MKILRYTDYSNSNEMLDFFISSLENPVVNESLDESYVRKILKGFSNDLKFNIGLIFTFGTGISAMVPVVQNLIKNGNLKIDPSLENIVLLSLTSMAILYLEETKNKIGDVEVDCLDCKSKGCENCKNGKVKSRVTRSDAQTLLEELKMRGIGNGIVKKFVTVFKSVGNLIKTLFRNSKYPVKGLLEMFRYTALLIPVMNAINTLVGKYDLTPDNIIGNFLAIGASITTLVAKNSIDFLISKLKSKFKLKVPKNIELEKPMGDVINDQFLKTFESNGGVETIVEIFENLQDEFDITGISWWDNEHFRKDGKDLKGYRGPISNCEIYMKDIETYQSLMNKYFDKYAHIKLTGNLKFLSGRDSDSNYIDKRYRIQSSNNKFCLMVENLTNYKIIDVYIRDNRERIGSSVNDGVILIGFEFEELK